MLASVATDFGKRVAAARKIAGLTQKQLAPLVGMSQSNLSELETVAHESGKTAQLAYHCGVNAYWLATGEGDMLAGAHHPPVRQLPELPEALPIVLDALAAAPERARLRTALLAVLEDDAPAYRQRLAELLDPGQAAAPPTPDPAQVPAAAAARLSVAAHNPDAYDGRMRFRQPGEAPSRGAKKKT